MTPGAMDHDLYPYSPLPTRPTLQWPDGHHLAITVTVYVEYWNLAGSDEGSVVDRRMAASFSPQQPDYWTASIREYGHRIGVFRVIEVLDRLGIEATLVVDAESCMKYPFILGEATSRGWEIAASGIDANHLLSSEMTVDREHDVMRAATAAIVESTGRRPVGWFGSGRGESTRTPFVAALEGFDYLCDWPNDDQPYVLDTSPPIVSMPRQAEWDDAELIWARHAQPDRYVDVVATAAQTLATEGGGSARFMNLSIHPWVLGQSHHIAYFETALDVLRRRSDIWFASAERVASAYGEATDRH